MSASGPSRVRPHRIALLLETDGPGGAEVMLLQLADELRRRGHEVIPVGPRGREGWLSSELLRRGYELSQYHLNGPLDYAGYRGLRQILIDRRVEIAHSHEFTMAVYAGRAAQTLGIPHIITMHGDSWASRALRRRIAMRWAFRRSRAVVAVSKSTHADFVARLGIAPKSMLAIPNGILFAPGEREPVRRELGLGADDLLTIAVGNLVPRKGHITLLRALAALQHHADATRWHVAIAGSGTEEENLRGFAREAGIESRVHLLGTRRDIPNILAAADIFTMPSHWEGLPVALLEAMFSAKPVVASGISGIPEAITDGEHGLLTPPGDEAAVAKALERYLLDANARTRFGAAALARANSTFHVSAMTDAYERAYGIRTAS